MDHVAARKALRARARALVARSAGVTQRAIRTGELVPLKVVAHELGLSRVSLWRARQCRLRGMPKAIVVRGRVYWHKLDFPALDEAILFYQGRGVFERTFKPSRPS